MVGLLLGQLQLVLQLLDLGGPGPIGVLLLELGLLVVLDLLLGAPSLALVFHHVRAGAVLDWRAGQIGLGRERIASRMPARSTYG